MGGAGQARGGRSRASAHEVHSGRHRRWPVPPTKPYAGHLLKGALCSKGKKSQTSKEMEEVGALHFAQPKRCS